MELTRMISVYEEDLENLEEGNLYFCSKGQSWSGKDSKECFKNEWDKGVDVLVLFNNAKSSDFVKLTLDDVDELDIMKCDIDKYDEHRSTRDIKLKIINFADGREDVGYVEITVDYNN